MSNGLAKTSEKETTPAPTMYREIEQEENVARGCVEVIEIIAYTVTKKPRRRIPEKSGLQGEIMKDRDGSTMFEEIGHAPYFCQDPEDEQVFKDNNPELRTESFTVQLRKSTAIKYLNAERNMKKFKREV